MRTLKKSIRSYMYKVTFALVSVILVSVLVLSIANEQSRARETADKIFQQMDKILEENGKEMECLRKEYSQKCLHDAETIAYILEKNPKARYDRDELRKIADVLKGEANENCFVCCQGGDEFTLFYYGYEKEELLKKIESLKALQSGHGVLLEDGITVDLKFSMGSSIAHGAVDYDKMYREADEKMYEDKRMRKNMAKKA